MSENIYECRHHINCGDWADVEGGYCEGCESELSDSPVCSNASPWPPKDVIEKLVEASEILLNHYSYDSHGHELISHARDAAKIWLKQ